MKNSWYLSMSKTFFWDALGSALAMHYGLCVGMDGAVALYGGSSMMEMQSRCSVPINAKNFFRDAFSSVLGMQYGSS
jgi:H+/Cl- antiporter ClcA